MTRIPRNPWPKAVAVAAIAVSFATPALAGYDSPPPELLKVLRRRRRRRRTWTPAAGACC